MCPQRMESGHRIPNYAYAVLVAHDLMSEATAALLVNIIRAKTWSFIKKLLHIFAFKKCTVQLCNVESPSRNLIFQARAAARRRSQALAANLFFALQSPERHENE